VNRLTRPANLIKLGAVLLCLLALLAVSPGVGSQSVSVTRAWSVLGGGDSSSPAYAIAWQMRFPRAIKAMLAGVTLALCGAAFQTLFRNPLATPYTLGMASGAGLGALLAIKLRWTATLLGLSSVSIAAFAGAVAVLGVVFLLSNVSRRVTGNTLLLAGVTIGFFCSGMMMFVTWLADVTQTHQTVRWMMGDLETFGPVEIRALAPIVIPCWVVLFLESAALNQFDAGSDLAATRGVNVVRLEVLALLAGCVGVAGVVSMCGPVGFVGLIIPHLARLVIGRDHRLLLPMAGLMGGAFLIGCDFLTAWTPRWYSTISGRETTVAQMPIGVMTALIGTPIFLALLCWRMR